MKLLITGANGFLGRRVAERLRGRYLLNCLVRRDDGLPESEVFRFASFADDSFRQSLVGVDVVIHIAAQLHGPWPDLLTANVEFTRALVEGARSTARHFIYISTENVTQGNPDPYTRSKVLAERLVEGFPRHTIIRPTVIYGPSDRRYVGRLAALIRRLPFVPVLGPGHNFFQFIHVDDVAALIEQSIVKSIMGIYTAAGPEVISYNDFVELLMEQMAVRKPVVHFPFWLLKPAVRLLDLGLRNPPLTPGQIANLEKDRNYDITQLVNIFGYTPTPLRSGLAGCMGERR